MRSRFLLLGVLIGLVVFVLASAPIWVGSNVDYVIAEDVVYYHDLRSNITGYSGDVDFAIDTDQKINWTNSSGSFLVDLADVSDWLDIYSASTGNLTISAKYDNQTGFFIVPIQATNTTDDEFAGTNFEFQINATNDIPIFEDLNSTYDFPQSQGGVYTIYAADEEEHYPLNFDLTFLNNCTHAAWSGRTDGENCSIFNLSGTTSTSTVFDFNPGFNDVGTYWVNFSATDFNGTCPHSYCDVSSYEENKSTGVYLLIFNVYSSLTINVSNCTGGVIMEGDTFNCTINITTVGETDSLDFSSLANLTTRDYVGNKNWFYADATDSATNFFYSLPVSVTPGKSQVGNWTVAFSVDDGSTFETGQIEIFVNFTESSVSLDSISNVQLYDDYNISIRAYDEDLLIQDWTDVKKEVLTFYSNESSWASIGAVATGSGDNYSSSIVIINHSYALGHFGAEGNYSVNISVNDSVGNLDWNVFVVEILNESAPVWNVSLSSPVVLELVEGVNFVYNVSVNVSDPGENVSFYYENVSAELCSISAGNFNSSGMINFTPVDCDVGYHDVTIIAGNGKLNSSWSFNFSVLNVADDPVISAFTGDNGTVPQTDLDEGVNFLAPEGVASNFSLIIDDDDFLVPAEQESYYNESLTIDLVFTNSTGSVVGLFNFSFVEFESPNPESASYFVSFTPEVGDVGDYTVFINISDIAGTFVNRTWFLNVTESLDAPVLISVDNASLTIYENLDFDLNATDDEDDYDGLNLTYLVIAIDSDAPNLTVSGNNVEFDMSSNESYAGEWSYNVSVTDNDSMMDWQLFYLFVYGSANLVLPSENSSFSLTENVSSVLNFTINHSVGDNLVYEFWIDSISCTFQNSSNCSYGNFSFREDVVGFGNGSVLEWAFVSGFSDESYGNLKNLTVKVYPNATDLSDSQKNSIAVNFSFKLNISHTNAPMRAVAPIGLLQSDYNSNIDVDLSGYFEDEDVSDSYWMQNITFVKSSGHSDISVSYSSGWDIQIGTILNSAFNGFISILGNDSFSSDVVEDVEVRFTEPTVTSTPSSGGSSGSSTKLKFYSLRIIVPEDVIISDEDYIEIPFGLENTGTMDLHGIDLSSEVLYNNAFSDDVKIDLGVNYIDELKSGERKEYTMRILADTDRSGKYKATLFANISSPKFFDWGDFFIDLRRTNESEAEELLIFTEKIISDNPECLELTEVFRRASEAFEAGNEVLAMKIAEEVSAACEDAISANEQVRYRIEGFVERNFYYISFATLAIFFFGFIVYVYKRVRFNKSAEDKYIR